MMSWKFGAMVLSMVAIAACGSDGKTGTTSGDTGGSGGTGSGGNGGATTGTMTTGSMTTATGTSTTATGTSTGTGGGTCADGMDCTLCKQDVTCGQCCSKAHPAAQTKYASLLVSSCACDAASPCFMACGGMGGTMPPVCTDPNSATVACAMCVNGLGMNACVVKAQQNCVADAVCKDIAACAQSCAG